MLKVIGVKLRVCRHIETAGPGLSSDILGFGYVRGYDSGFGPLHYCECSFTGRTFLPAALRELDQWKSTIGSAEALKTLTIFLNFDSAAAVTHGAAGGCECPKFLGRGFNTVRGGDMRYSV